MGVLGFLIGLVVGWSVTSFILGYLPIELPCLYKFLFFCIIGPHIILALIVGYIVSKMIPI